MRDVCGGNRAGAIVRHPPHHVGVAAPQQNGRNCFAEYRARRDRELMGLTHGVRNVDQVGLAQAWRLLQHRAGGGDVVVAGERSQQSRRRIRQGRQTNRQLGPGFAFNVFNQESEDVVKDVDVQFIVRAGPVEEQRGNALQGVDALLTRPVDDDLLQFRDQR
jgi:hypothetical protein